MQFFVCCGTLFCRLVCFFSTWSWFFSGRALEKFQFLIYYFEGSNLKLHELQCSAGIRTGVRVCWRMGVLVSGCCFLLISCASASGACLPASGACLPALGACIEPEHLPHREPAVHGFMDTNVFYTEDKLRKQVDTFTGKVNI